MHRVKLFDALLRSLWEESMFWEVAKISGGNREGVHVRLRYQAVKESREAYTYTLAHAIILRRLKATVYQTHPTDQNSSMKYRATLRMYLYDAHPIWQAFAATRDSEFNILKARRLLRDYMEKENKQDVNQV